MIIFPYMNLELIFFSFHLRQRFPLGGVALAVASGYGPRRGRSAWLLSAAPERSHAGFDKDACPLPLVVHVTRLRAGDFVLYLLIYV